MALTLPEPIEAPVEYSSEYDPRKPEYVIQVSEQEANSLHAALLRQQMEGLQSVLRSQKDGFYAGSKDSGVLRHYETVLMHLAIEFNALVLDDDILAQSPVLSERATKAAEESPGRRSTCSVSTTCTGYTSRSKDTTCSVDTCCDIDSVANTIGVENIEVDADKLSLLWRLLDDEENEGKDLGKGRSAQVADSRLLGLFEIDLDSLSPSRRFLKKENDAREDHGKRWPGQCADCENSASSGSSNSDYPIARHSAITEVDVDNLSPVWQLLENEEEDEGKNDGKAWSAQLADSRPVGSLEVDVDAIASITCRAWRLREEEDKEWDDHVEIENNTIVDSSDSDCSSARSSIVPL